MGLSTLAPLGKALAQDAGTVPANTPTTAPAPAASDNSTTANPAGTSPTDDTSNQSRAQVPDATQNPAHPQPTSIPVFPGQSGNPLSPYNSSSVNPQSPLITAPSLYLTGNHDLSQISTNNALSQAFSQQGFGSSDLYGEDTGMDYEHPPIERLRLGPIDLKAAVTTSVVNDDNPRTFSNSQGESKGDTTFTLSPAVLLEYGNHEGQKGYASLIYAPTFTRFYHQSAEDSDDQNVSLNVTYPLQRIVLNATQTYTQTSGVNSDSNVRTTQTSSQTLLGGSYNVDDRISVSSQVQELVTSFSNPNEQNGSGGSGQSSTSTSINNSANYSISEKLSAGPNFNIGFDRPDDSPNSTFEQAGVSLNYAATEKIGIYAQGGVEFRQYDHGGGDDTNPIYSLGASYTPFDSTSMGLNVSQGVHTSTAAIGQATAGQTVVTTNVGATVTQRIVQRVFVSMAFTYSHEENQGQSGDASVSSTGSTEDNFSYQPSISFSPTAWTSISLNYQYLTNESDLQGQSYHSNQVGMSFSAQF